MKSQQLKTTQKNPDSLSKEMEILYELGLEDYEIKYLIFLKTKREVSLKWQN